MEPGEEDELGVHVCKEEKIEGKVEPKRDYSTLKKSF